MFGLSYVYAIVLEILVTLNPTVLCFPLKKRDAVNMTKRKEGGGLYLNCKMDPIQRLYLISGYAYYQSLNPITKYLPFSAYNSNKEVHISNQITLKNKSKLN